LLPALPALRRGGEGNAAVDRSKAEARSACVERPFPRRLRVAGTVERAVLLQVARIASGIVPAEKPIEAANRADGYDPDTVRRRRAAGKRRASGAVRAAVFRAFSLRRGGMGALQRASPIRPA